MQNNNDNLNNTDNTDNIDDADDTDNTDNTDNTNYRSDTISLVLQMFSQIIQNRISNVNNSVAPPEENRENIIPVKVETREEIMNKINIILNNKYKSRKDFIYNMKSLIDQYPQIITEQQNFIKIRLHKLYNNNVLSILLVNQKPDTRIKILNQLTNKEKYSKELFKKYLMLDLKQLYDVISQANLFDDLYFDNTYMIEDKFLYVYGAENDFIKNSISKVINSTNFMYKIIRKHLKKFALKSEIEMNFIKFLIDIFMYNNLKQKYSNKVIDLILFKKIGLNYFNIIGKESFLLNYPNIITSFLTKDFKLSCGCIKWKFIMDLNVDVVEKKNQEIYIYKVLQEEISNIICFERYIDLTFNDQNNKFKDILQKIKDLMDIFNISKRTAANMLATSHYRRNITKYEWPHDIVIFCQ